jgi:hypothetical protein
VALGVAVPGAAALAILEVSRREPTPDAGSPDAADAIASTTSTDGESSQCASCHAPIVDTYRGHGMSRSVGRAEGIAPGTVTNPASGVRYTIERSGGSASLTASMPDGGTRRQRIVGRVGAGIFDVSWVGTEMDPAGRAETGRLFFAPVETLQAAAFSSRRSSFRSIAGQIPVLVPTSTLVDFRFVGRWSASRSLRASSRLPR